MDLALYLLFLTGERERDGNLRSRTPFPFHRLGIKKECDRSLLASGQGLRGDLCQQVVRHLP